jgi:hypothetical protein
MIAKGLKTSAHSHFMRSAHSHPAGDRPTDTDERDSYSCLRSVDSQRSSTYLPDFSDEEGGAHDQAKEHESCRPDIAEHKGH